MELATEKKTLKERLDEWAAYYKQEVGCTGHGVCDCFLRAIEILDRDTQRIAKYPTQFQRDAVKLQKAFATASAALSSLVERTKPDGYLIVMYGKKPPRKSRGRKQ